KYDVVKDFEPISLVAFDPQIIAVKKTLPVAALSQLVTWLKERSGDAVAGTAGIGSTSHVSAVRFQSLTGTQFRFVPYRGLGPAMVDLVGGHIDILFDLAGNSVPQVREGTIKGLAVTAPRRLASAPDIPTVDEAGLPGFHFLNWHAIWAPRGISADVAVRLNAAGRELLGEQGSGRGVAGNGPQNSGPAQQTPPGAPALPKERSVRWWPVIKAANIQGE